MGITLEDTGVLIVCGSLSRSQLEALARTYDTAGSPVWIESPTGQCLYRNRMAAGESRPRSAFATFDILDLHGQVVVCLRTVAHA